MGGADWAIASVDHKAAAAMAANVDFISGSFEGMSEARWLRIGGSVRRRYGLENISPAL
jgi:hypothetical protein